MEYLSGLKLGGGAVCLEPFRHPRLPLHHREGDDQPPYWESCRSCQGCDIVRGMCTEGAFPVIRPESVKALEDCGILEDALTWLETELLPVLQYVCTNLPHSRGETREDVEVSYQCNAKVIAKWADFAQLFNMNLEMVMWRKCKSCTEEDAVWKHRVSSSFSLVALGSVHDRMSSRVKQVKERFCASKEEGRDDRRNERGVVYPDWLPVCRRFVTPDFVHFSGEQRTLWAIALSYVSLATLAKSCGREGLADSVLVDVIKCGDQLLDADKAVLKQV